MTTTARTLLLLVPATLVACSTSSDGDTRSAVGKPLTSPYSFVVHGQLSLTTPNGGPSLDGPGPSPQDFVLRVDPAGRTSLVGSPAQAVRAALTSDDGVAFRTTESFSLALFYSGCGSKVTYTDFHFTAGSDALIGTAAGTAYINQGDVRFDYLAHLDFMGVPDTIGPSLDGPGADLDPLMPLILGAAEPLPDSAAARMVAGGELVNLTPILTAGTGAVTGFEKPDVALRYATTYAVVVDPWTDLAGNPGGPINDITTAAPPPLIAEDGFESAAATLGGGSVVDASVIPPISGQKSVLLGEIRGVPGIGAVFGIARMTVRLAVNPGDRFVRFSLRPISSYSSTVGTYRTSIRCAVPGGEIARVALPTTETLDAPQMLANGVTVWLGAPRSVEAALPAGTADELVFDFSTGRSSDCGPPTPTASYLLDDLRVE